MFDFRVNTTTINWQYRPSISRLENGGFVVAWMSNYPDPLQHDLYGQIFDPNGKKIGAEFQLNSFTNGDQLGPSVAGLADGGFIVAWHGDGVDGGGWKIYSQRFNEKGIKIGSETSINKTPVPGYGAQANAIAKTDGGWLISWSQNGIKYGQAFDPNGNVIQNLLNFGPSPYDGSYGSVIELPNNGWLANNGSGVSNILSANGNLISSDILTTNVNRFKNVLLADQGWMTIWSNQDVLYFQRFDSSGGRTSAGTIQHGAIYNYDIASLIDGGWVIAWQDLTPEDDQSGIFFRRYNAQSQAVKETTRVDSYVSNDHSSRFPAIVSTGDGGWVVTWEAFPQDGSGMGVYAKYYDKNGSPVDTLQNTLALHAAEFQVPNLIPNGEVVGQTRVTNSIGPLSYHLIGGNLDHDADGVSPFEVRLDGRIYVTDSDDVNLKYTSSFDLLIAATDASGMSEASFRIVLTGFEKSVHHKVGSTYQDFSDVVGLVGGGWVVTWVSEDQSSLGIFGRQYDSNGAPVGDGFQINSKNDWTESAPLESVATPDGGWITTWTGEDGIYFKNTMPTEWRPQAKVF